MSGNEYINMFSAHLFWDVRKEDVDFDEHAQYIIKRVLEYGLLEDWNLIRQYYGLPKEQFRCYIWKQSNIQHWNF